MEIKAWKGTWDSYVGAVEDRQGFLEVTVQTMGLALDQGRSHTEPMGPGAFSSLEFIWSRLLNFLNTLSSVPSGRMKALGSYQGGPSEEAHDP